MWFNPRELQKQDTTLGKFCECCESSSNDPPKLAKLARLAAPSILKIEERDQILDWLKAIGETNNETITNVIHRCQEDQTTRDYFLRASSTHKAALNIETDGRHYCHECDNLSITGHCLAARRSEIKASRDYRPMGDLPFRCEGFKPK